MFWNKYPLLVFLPSSSYYPCVGTFILHSKTMLSRVLSMFWKVILRFKRLSLRLSINYFGISPPPFDFCFIKYLGLDSIRLHILVPFVLDIHPFLCGREAGHSMDHTRFGRGQFQRGRWAAGTQQRHRANTGTLRSQHISHFQITIMTLPLLCWYEKTNYLTITSLNE